MSKKYKNPCNSCGLYDKKRGYCNHFQMESDEAQRECKTALSALRGNDDPYFQKYKRR
jgi:hypothetical protein